MAAAVSSAGHAMPRHATRCTRRTSKPASTSVRMVTAPAGRLPPDLPPPPPPAVLPAPEVDAWPGWRRCGGRRLWKLCAEEGAASAAACACDVACGGSSCMACRKASACKHACTHRAHHASCFAVACPQRGNATHCARRDCALHGHTAATLGGRPRNPTPDLNWWPTCCMSRPSSSVSVSDMLTSCDGLTGGRSGQLAHVPPLLARRRRGRPQ